MNVFGAQQERTTITISFSGKHSQLFNYSFLLWSLHKIDDTVYEGQKEGGREKEKSLSQHPLGAVQETWLHDTKMISLSVSALVRRSPP